MIEVSTSVAAGGEEEGSVVWIILCSTVTGQVLDADHMMSKTALGHQQDLHPVIQTLYDHADLRCLPTCALWVV